MTGRFAQRRVSVFWGTVKWLPVVALPFSVFFFETWLQVRIYERGYEASTLRREIRDITAHVDRLQERVDELTALKRAGERAPDLGLSPIRPGQVEVVYAPPSSENAPIREVTPETIAIANADVPHGSTRPGQ
ncbi:MAG: hypothetical protein FJY92_07525 [Candidatus Hydrogenedentes bacterium]|nr:hypothetical protein [Candidatus Hydrogenedentota bacterium]